MAGKQSARNDAQVSQNPQAEQNYASPVIGPPSEPQPKRQGLLYDGEGKPSTMRLMSFIALGASIWFGWLTLSEAENNNIGIYITSAFLLAAFVPKALQKYIENSMPGNQGNKR